MPNALLAPNRIGLQYQFGVSYHPPISRPGPLQFPPQLFATIHPRVGGNPKLPAKFRRLPLEHRFFSGPKQSVAQANRTIRVSVASIRSRIGKIMREALQKRSVNGRSAPIEHAYDSAQLVPIQVACPSNGTK